MMISISPHHNPASSSLKVDNTMLLLGWKFGSKPCIFFLTAVLLTPSAYTFHGAPSHSHYWGSQNGSRSGKSLSVLCKVRPHGCSLHVFGFTDNSHPGIERESTRSVVWVITQHPPPLLKMTGLAMSKWYSNWKRWCCSFMSTLS